MNKMNDDVSKDEQGLNVRLLFMRTDYFLLRRMLWRMRSLSKKPINATKNDELPRYTNSFQWI